MSNKNGNKESVLISVDTNSRFSYSTDHNYIKQKNYSHTILPSNDFCILSSLD